MKFKIPLLILRYSLMLCLILGFTAQSVFAQGRMVIEPIIEIGMRTDSNFHKSETNEKRVHTYNVKPGIKFGYTTDKSLVSLDYFANILRYDDQDTIPAGQLKADDYDYVAHRALFRAQTQTTDHLLLGMDNLFIKSSDPASADTSSNAVDRYEYTMNSFSPRLVYNFGEKFGLGLKYTNLITDYSNDAAGEGEDSDENRGTFTLFYYLNPGTFFNLDYQTWSRDYDETSSDYDSDQVMVNVSHQFNYFTVSAGAGYHARDFDQTVASGDIDQFVWKFSITGQNPPDAAGIPKSSIYLAIGGNLNDSGSGDDYYNATRFDARVTHLFLGKINCTLAGWFQNSDYETSVREDDRWLLSAGADYLINDFFTLGLEGGIEDRDSNEAGRDFDNKYVMFNIKFNYNLGSK
ncbi:outer membrane beta-barrel protein [Desulfobacula sp.]|uniref:outer membrane beta-barrel protein n=1 Tax=Desulfobacula sp. TaxID=2593537 RepID=UPI0025C2DC70|nr:outer membrane beta-barrel protein [Desulfobacula sp.]MBC2705980.1 outer membrane beta-barrel protein [Desulfobacula sp.]